MFHQRFLYSCMKSRFVQLGYIQVRTGTSSFSLVTYFKKQNFHIFWIHYI